MNKKQENFLDMKTSVLIHRNKFRAFGNNLAFHLKGKDRHQQVIAEKLISGVLFQFKLGNLKVSSIILTEQSNQPKLQSLNVISTTTNNQ